MNGVPEVKPMAKNDFNVFEENFIYVKYVNFSKRFCFILGVGK
jgi:hypothetical protein